MWSIGRFAGISYTLGVGVGREVSNKCNIRHWRLHPVTSLPAEDGVEVVWDVVVLVVNLLLANPELYEGVRLCGRKHH